MTWFNYNEHAAWPIQESPIYGIEYDSKTKDRRFMTLRLRDFAIVKFSNKWVAGFGTNGRWRLKCSNNMLMMGYTCHAGNCDNLSLLCGKVMAPFQTVASKRTIVRPKNAGSSIFCPDGMYAQGLECVGKGCKNPGLFCVQLTFSTISMSQTQFSSVGNRNYVSATFNSDGYGFSWRMGGPIYAISCIGKAECESKQLYSAERGIGSMMTETTLYRGPISAAGSSVSCPKKMVIVVMRCTGQFCSSIHIGCASFKDETTYRVTDTDVRMSNTFSTHWPHQAIGTCPDGYFAKSIECLRFSCSVLMIGCVKIYIRQ